MVIGKTITFLEKEMIPTFIYINGHALISNL